MEPQRAEGLPRWSEVGADLSKAAKLGSSEPAEQSAALPTGGSQPKPRFPFSQPINSFIAVWEKSFTELSVDAVVCPTNESASDIDGPHEILRNLGGDQMQVALLGITPLRMGEAKLTHSYNIAPRNVVHTVGPRFNPKYVTAAVNSLNRCYLNALQACIDGGLRSVAFLPLHSEQRGYPLQLGAHVACRTVRRFLEHFNDKFDVIVFCLHNEPEKSAYMQTLALYAPLSDEAAIEAEKVLPKDTGNEWGEEFDEERTIRISAIPGMGGGCRDDEFDEDEDAPGSGPLTLMERIQSPDTRAQQILYASNMQTQTQPNAALPPPVQQQQSPRDTAEVDALPQSPYNDMLKRAVREDLRDMEATQVVYRAGVDNERRPIVVIVGAHIPPAALNNGKFLRYMVRLMDDMAEQQYNIVYLHSANADNQTAVQWIRTLFTVFPEKYQRNLHSLVVVYSTFWLRMFLRVSSALTYTIPYVFMDNLAQLFHQYDSRQLLIPADIIRNDQSLAQSAEHSSGY